MEAQPMDLCFVAAHPTGSLRLRVPHQPGDRTAAGAAVALEECDGLLEALDDWLGTELEWQWEEEAPLPGPALARAGEPDCGAGPTDRSHVALATATVTGRAAVTACAKAVGCRLEAPWSLLRSSARPPATLAMCLRWQETPALFTLCRLLLDEAEQAAIEPGGAVVLPDSLRSDWRGWLHLPGEDPEQGIPLGLEGPTPARPRGTGLPHPAPTSVGAMRLCQVRLAMHQLLPASLLAGWQDPGPLVAELAARQAELWIGLPEGAGATRLLAQGRLLPWGHGWAMTIDQLH